MKKNILIFLVGLGLGWATVPVVKADRIPFLVDNGGDAKSYKDLLRKVIGLMEDIKAIDQQTADNTKAIREKLGAK